MATARASYDGLFAIMRMLTRAGRAPAQFKYGEEASNPEHHLLNVESATKLARRANGPVLEQAGVSIGLQKMIKETALGKVGRVSRLTRSLSLGLSPYVLS